MYISLFNLRRIDPVTLEQSQLSEGMDCYGPVFSVVGEINFSNKGLTFVEDLTLEECFLSRGVDDLTYYDGKFWAGLSITEELPSVSRLEDYDSVKADSSNYEKRWQIVHTRPGEPDMYCMGLCDSWSINKEDGFLFTKVGAQAIVPDKATIANLRANCPDDLLFAHQREDCFDYYDRIEEYLS